MNSHLQACPAPLKEAFTFRVAFLNALLFATALVSRTAYFVLDFQEIRSAARIGWPFAVDMLLLSVVGMSIGFVASVLAYYNAANAASDARANRLALVGLFCNLALPLLAFALVFPMPHYIMHGVNFD